MYLNLSFLYWYHLYQTYVIHSRAMCANGREHDLMNRWLLLWPIVHTSIQFFLFPSIPIHLFRIQFLNTSLFTTITTITTITTTINIFNINTWRFCFEESIANAKLQQDMLGIWYWMIQKEKVDNFHLHGVSSTILFLHQMKIHTSLENLQIWFIQCMN